MAGIYVHIPFCKQACHYCDFHFSTRVQSIDKVVDAICHELSLQKNYLQAPIETIYFGGGTPSILPQSALDKIFDSFARHFDLSSVAEITMEANPDDLSPQHLTILKAIGINRLSIGIQSFNDKYLSYYNRSHDAQQAMDSVLHAQSVGFDNLSLDLIFGAPNQTRQEVESDLLQLLALDVPHISLYGMTIENDTAFGRWYKKDQLTPLEDDLAAEQFELIMNQLAEAGYVQYEISNFARPGHESRHNSSYWHGKHYLGVGPSAHSYNGLSRQYNIANNAKYIKAIESESIPCEIENLSQTDRINESILIQLRLHEGISLDRLRSQYGFDLQLAKSEPVNEFIENKMISIVDQQLMLTRKGRLLADYITEKLIIDDI